MKTLLRFSAVLCTMLVFSFANAQKTCTVMRNFCFTDGFGITYSFHDLTGVSLNTYYAEGTSDAYPSSTAKLHLNLVDGFANGKITMWVINDASDNCVSFSDSFVYKGQVTIVQHKGDDEASLTYSGSGNWTSYCFGGPLNSGTWSAQGPCAQAGATKVKQTGLTPADGKQKMLDSKKGIIVSISPNPVNNFTTIRYSVKDAGKVNITVYNSMQQPVKVLVNESKAAGTYTVSWNTQNANGPKVTSGVYRVVAVTEKGVSTSDVQVIN